MQIKIDRELCCSYRACQSICPEVFKHDKDGVVYVESEVVPSGLETQVKAAATACPQNAIMIVEKLT